MAKSLLLKLLNHGEPQIQNKAFLHFIVSTVLCGITIYFYIWCITHRFLIKADRFFHVFWCSIFIQVFVLMVKQKKVYVHFIVQWENLRIKRK